MKQSGYEGNVSILSECKEQTYLHESDGQEMDKEHYNRVTPPLILLSKDSHLLLLQISSGERHEKLAGTARSSSDGTDTAPAVTQRHQLFHSDSLQMPPGRQAKINTVCSVTGMQQEHYTSTTP